ncbi:hypothetical protein AgCh_003061 [Apium graveolens]
MELVQTVAVITTKEVIHTLLDEAAATVEEAVAMEEAAATMGQYRDSEGHKRNRGCRRRRSLRLQKQRGKDTAQELKLLHPDDFRIVCNLSSCHKNVIVPITCIKRDWCILAEAQALKAKTQVKP